MKLVGILLAIIGGALFFSHLVEVYLNGERETGMFTHHWLSLIGGGAMLTGITLYVIGRRQTPPSK